jgi:hypothetical protein
MMALANAGTAALMGGLRTMVAQAMLPDVSEMDRASAAASGPDVPELMRLIGDNVRVAGTGMVDGSETWTLEVIDPSRLPLPRAEGFTPERVVLRIDRDTYVLRGSLISGQMPADGRIVPVSVETTLEDYREAGGLLYPFRTVTIVRGVAETLTAEERDGLAELPADLDARRRRVRDQLDRMPPEQREMAERMLAQQLPQLEQMLHRARGTAGGEPIAVDVKELVVNRGRPESLAVLGRSLR